MLKLQVSLELIFGGDSIETSKKRDKHDNGQSHMNKFPILLMAESLKIGTSRAILRHLDVQTREGTGA